MDQVNKVNLLLADEDALEQHELYQGHVLNSYFVYIMKLS